MRALLLGKISIYTYRNSDLFSCETSNKTLKGHKFFLGATGFCEKKREHDIIFKAELDSKPVSTLCFYDKLMTEKNMNKNKLNL